MLRFGADTARTTMKLRILSDLHTEFADFVPPETDAEAETLAGDIGVGAEGMRWATRHYPVRPVIYVPGNHEFYGHDPDFCNPRGYPGEYGRTGFKPDFTVVV